MTTVESSQASDRSLSMILHPPGGPAAGAPAPGGSLAERYGQVRGFTEALCEPLAIEDYVLQSMPDASPTKWHLAHTSWFFETFVLVPALPGYRAFHPRYSFLFNSYYNAVGERHCRPRRGLLSRPTVEETYRYRAHVDRAVSELLDRGEDVLPPDLRAVVDLWLHHEQQHQELILTDIKHAFSMNPLRPAYRERAAGPPCASDRDSAVGRSPDGDRSSAHGSGDSTAHSGSEGQAAALGWVGFDEGVRWTGHAGEGFAFDNEGPRHREFVPAFEFADRPVTSGEYRAFIEDRGYERPELWLSAGWATVQEHRWEAPLYWERADDGWYSLTLAGYLPVDDAEPVCHISLFEADAYARWAGARLPTEAEWEVAASGTPLSGNFVESGRCHPGPAGAEAGLRQLYGDVWEWTRSDYSPYPGYEPDPGALGEYNGKFMCGQYVLRGGSCATSRTHIRPTYRNFFPPEARWQFTGLRLARDVR